MHPPPEERAFPILRAVSGRCPPGSQREAWTLPTGQGVGRTEGAPIRGLPERLLWTLNPQRGGAGSGTAGHRGDHIPVWMKTSWAEEPTGGCARRWPEPWGPLLASLPQLSDKFFFFHFQGLQCKMLPSCLFSSPQESPLPSAHSSPGGRRHSGQSRALPSSVLQPAGGRACGGRWHSFPLPWAFQTGTQANLCDPGS